MSLCLFVIKQGRTKYGIKRTSYKAHRSPPFIIDEARWFWSGTHYFSWSESQGLTNGKLQQNHCL